MTNVTATEAPLTYEEARAMSITFGVPVEHFLTARLARAFRAYEAQWEARQLTLVAA